MRTSLQFLAATLVAITTKFAFALSVNEVFEKFQLVGDFDAGSVIDVEGPVSVNAVYGSLLSKNAGYTMIKKPNGQIRAICTLGEKDVYLGGYFTDLDGHKTNYIARYHIDTKVIEQLGAGLDGPVNTLYCDPKTNTVVAGGNFDGTADGSVTSSSLIIWEGNSSKWRPAFNTGLNGPVHKIRSQPDGTLILTGEFVSTGDKKIKNPMQRELMTVTSQGSTIDGNSLLCNNDNSKTFVFDQPGSQVTYNFPRKSSLDSIRVASAGTKSFRLLALNSGEILELSYASDSGTFRCTDCPLKSATSAQDYRIIKSTTEFDGLIFVPLSAFDGSSNAVNSLQIFQNDVDLIASADLSSPTCKTLNVISKANSGPWTTVSVTPNRKVLSVTGGEASTTFTYVVQQSSVYIVTNILPSCMQSGGCDSRGTLEIT